MSKTLVIVESPTKAKTISKFLGSNYTILSSFGHIRDLPKSDIGVDVEQQFTPTYVVPPRSKSHVTELRKAAKDADEVILATDEDREGEAIAWHILEALKLNPEDVKRITFHEITKSAIEEALDHPRTIDQTLVDAQQARRILDRLVGYKLSPFLWEKVRRGLSAGRVQSVATRLIVERERERRAFNIEEYWTIDAQCAKGDIVFDAKMTHRNGEKLEKLSISTEEEAAVLVADVQSVPWTVSDITTKRVKKSPPSPYTTSTLQMDGNNKLHFSAKQTMTLAQKLYETGRITYMRTDSLNLSEAFLNATQTFAQSTFGTEYATGARTFKTKKKGAQEAHEAIRPTDVTATPESLKGTLDSGQWKLYDMIWRRSVASQLPAAQLDRTAVNLQAGAHTFRSNGNRIAFDGFMRVYRSAKEKILPDLKEGKTVSVESVTPNQHFTEPPARYSDATLVKVLEEHGIGRPSTYAPTISTIIDRGYVERDDNKKLFPTDIATIVTDLLVGHFPQIVDFEFTATLEKSLDEIAEGTVEWVPMLEAFYGPFAKNLETKSKELSREDIMPDRVLGKDPETDLDVIVRTGRFGAYAQLGPWSKEDQEAKQNKPKSASLLRGVTYESATLQDALDALSFPRVIGATETGEEIQVLIGRFGPYIKAGEATASIKEPYTPTTVDEASARVLLKESIELKKKMKEPIATLGTDPASGGEILVKHGRFGPYITDGETNVSIRKTQDPTEVTLEIAIEMLKKKRENPGRGRRGRSAKPKAKMGKLKA